MRDRVAITIYGFLDIVTLLIIGFAAQV